MNELQKTYYEQRAARERGLAERALVPEARRAHETLARMYNDLVLKESEAPAASHG